jgi:acyl-CoA dehydrogenase
MYRNLTDSEIELKKTLGLLIKRSIIPIEHEVLENGSLSDIEIDRLKLEALELGVYAANIPKEFGGPGRSHTEICLINEELGKVLPIFSQICRFPPRILIRLDDGLHGKYTIPCAKGEKVCGVAWAGTFPEAHFSDLPTTAEPDGDYWILNGGKYFVENGDACDCFILFARSCHKSRNEILAFIVDRESVDVEPLRDPPHMRIDGVCFSEVMISNCRIPCENMLGETGQGVELINEWLEETRLLVAARALGLMERCLQAARRHAIRKRVGGRPIALRQGAQWKLADMAMEIRGLRLMLYNVARELDRGIRNDHKILMVRFQASEAAARVADMALAILCSDGLMENGPITRIIEGARASKFYPESWESLKTIIAGSVFESV